MDVHMGIQLADIVFGYGTHQVVCGASLHLPAGQFGAILGRNGSGKSTLLRIAAGLQLPHEGTVQVAGDNLHQLDARQRAKRVGFLAQFHQPEFSFLVHEVVLTGRASSVFSVPGEQDRAAAWQAMEELGITHLAHRPYDELSGGERQMVMIARLLAQNPSALLLDEPVSSLDLANQMHLLRTLRRLADQGLTVLAILHDPNHALLFADQVFYMESGCISQPEKDAPLADAARISRLYGIEVCTADIEGTTVVIPKPDRARQSHGTQEPAP
ncbi:MAG: ABC transporter ATP-binding protein [Brachymonas sp.]|nr:ABC transporter ATP-binding protein [Brachymonas sp.]